MGKEYTKYRYRGKYSDLHYLDNGNIDGLAVYNSRECNHLSLIETFDYMNSIINRKIFIKGMLNEDYLENSLKYIIQDMVRKLKLENVLSYINIKYALKQSSKFDYREVMYIANYIYEIYNINPTSLTYNAVIHCMDVLLNVKFKSNEYIENICDIFEKYIHSDVETIRTHAQLKVSVIKRNDNINDDCIVRICSSLRDVEDLSICHYTPAFFNHIIANVNLSTTLTTSEMVTKLFNSMSLSLSNNDLDIVTSLNLIRIIALCKRCDNIPYRVSESIERAKVTVNIIRDINHSRYYIDNTIFTGLSIYQMMRVISELSDLYTKNRDDIKLLSHKGCGGTCGLYDNNDEIFSTLKELFRCVYTKYGAFKILKFILNSSPGYIQSMRNMLTIILDSDIDLYDDFISNNIRISIDELITIASIAKHSTVISQHEDAKVYRYINTVFATNFTKIVNTTNMKCIYKDILLIFHDRLTATFKKHSVNPYDYVVDASKLITFEQLLVFKEDLSFLVNDYKYDLDYYINICGTYDGFIPYESKCSDIITLYVKTLFINGLGECVECKDTNASELEKKNVFKRMFEKWVKFLDNIEK